MVTAILLAMLLFAVFVIGYYMNDCDLLAPSILFTLGFLLCSLMYVICYSVWNYEISIECVLIITLGAFGFCTVNALLNKISFSKQTPRAQSIAFKPVQIKPVIIVIVALCSILVALLTVRQISQLYPSESWVTSISLYDRAKKFDEGEFIGLGSFLGYARLLVSAFTLYISYLLAQELAIKRIKNTPVLLLAFFGGCISSLATGSRTGVFVNVLSILVMFFIIRRQITGEKKILNIKTFTVILVIAILFLVIFQFLAIGRDLSNYEGKYLNYIAIYIGAQIPNLDIYLHSSGWYSSPFPSAWTFHSFWAWVGSNIGNASLSDLSELPLPFLNSNGSSLGNVYTCYYNFIGDFGLIGILVCVILYSTISAFVYKKLFRSYSRNNDFWMIIYANLSIYLFLSFFSEKVFEAVIAPNFIKSAILLLIVKWVYISLVHVQNQNKRDNTLVTSNKSRLHFHSFRSY